MTAALDATPLFTELGRALYAFQAIEVRLKLILPHLAIPGTEDPAAGEGWSGRLKYLESKEMMGNLVKLLQQRITISHPEEMAQHWNEVVQGRNEVVHKFALQPFAACATPDDLANAIEYVRVRRHRAIPMLEMLDTIANAFLVSLRLPPDFEGEVPLSGLRQGGSAA